MKIKLWAPIYDFDFETNVNQVFGVNAEAYRPRGIPAHNGLDIDVRDEKSGYGTKIISAHTKDAKCTRVYSDFPTKTRGTGVYLQEQLENGWFLETVYWHLADVHVKPGDTVHPQTVIGKMGNTGWVKPPPTRLCVYCGTHLHWGVRLYDKEGNIIGGNDYAGYRDPAPFLYNAGYKIPTRLSRDLWIGSQGDEVSYLQTALKFEGFAEDYEPIGYFGAKTLRDVKKLQSKYGINPVLGYCGRKTRGFLNSKYAV